MSERTEHFDADPFTADSFTAHVTGLRRLAHSLVRCPVGADDAVQETLARAVGAPGPSAASRVGAWLRTILRNVVTSEHRQRSRREVREQQSRSSAELAPSTLDLIARRETLERVSRAIAALPAPLQSVVFLRHFDDLPPREIAARLSLDVAVVHRRLHRAHAELRRALAAEGRDRSWRAGLVGLFGGRTTATFPTTGPLPWVAFLNGASVMTLTSKLILGVAAISALTLPFLLRDSEAPSAPDTTVAAAEQEPAERRAAVGEASPERSDVVAQPAATATPTADLETHEFELLVRATDQDDYPVKMSVYVAPLHHPLNLVGWTDQAGHLLVRWRGSTSRAQFVIAEDASRTRLRRFEVVAGVRAQVALRSPARFDAGPKRQQRNELGLALTSDFLVEGLARNRSLPPRVITLADGSIRFVHSATEVAKNVAPTVTAGSRVSFSVSGGATVSESSAEQPPATTRIDVLVRDAFGGPVEDALVAAFGADQHSPHFRTRTDASGRATIPALTAGPWRVRAGGGEHGIATQEFELDAAVPQVEWTANLDRGAELLGRLLDTNGKPLDGWLVHADSCDESGAWADEARSAPDGTFAIPNVPQRLHSLRVTPPPDEGLGGSITLPPAWCGDRWPTVAPVDVVVAQSGAARATLQANLHVDATQRDGLQVRLWHSESAHGTSLPLDFRSADESRVLALVVHGLAPGDYELQVGGAAIAWRDFGRVQLTAEQTTDLGIATFDLPSRLSLPTDRSSCQLLAELPHGYSVIEWRRTSTHRSSRSETLQLADGITVELLGAIGGVTDLHFGDWKGDASESARASIVESAPLPAEAPAVGSAATSTSTVDLPPGRYLWVGSTGARTWLELRSGEGASIDAAASASAPAAGGTSRTLTR